jgi:glycosyltransferase involved in cell wall biosynthesis
MKVAYLHRKIGIGHSIERLFEDIRGGLPSSINFEVWHARHHSLYPHWIFKNIFDAKQIEADIFHTVGDAYYLALAHPKEKSILTIHDCVALNRLTGAKKKYFYKLWYQWPVRHAGVVTTVSKASADELVEKVPEVRSKLVVIPNCVSDAFQYSKKQDENEKFTILQVGTQANKNIERLISAISGTPCELRIVGPLTMNQHNQIKKAGIQVVVLGSLSKDAIIEEYRRCDAVSFLSTYEGFGLPIIEAQAIGRPVITSNIPPMDEVAGDAALKVDPYDVRAIRTAILRLCSERVLQEELILQGLENVKQYRVPLIAERYAQLYKDIYH